MTLITIQHLSDDIKIYADDMKSEMSLSQIANGPLLANDDAIFVDNADWTTDILNFLLMPFVVPL